MSPLSPNNHSTGTWVVLDLPVDVPETQRCLRLHMVPTLRQLNPAPRWNVSSYSNHTQQVKCKAWASPPVQPAELSARKIWFAKAKIQQNKKETLRCEIYFTCTKARKSDLSFWQLLQTWDNHLVSILKLIRDIKKCQVSCKKWQAGVWWQKSAHQSGRRIAAAMPETLEYKIHVLRVAWERAPKQWTAAWLPLGENIE